MHQTWHQTKANKRHSNYNYDATHVIKHFFHLFGKWKWPEPVALIEVNPRDKWQRIQIEQLEKNSGITSWNPENNFAEKFHVGYIIVMGLSIGYYRNSGINRNPTREIG